MITNDVITLWHRGYNQSFRMDEWVLIGTFPASVQKDHIVTPQDKGIASSDTVRVRIPIADELPIKNGDKAIIGASEDEKPPQNAHTVLAFADNRKGSRAVRHWKVVLS